MALQNITGMKVISSEYATEEDGYEEKEVLVKRGGFWERLFDPDPSLHMWDDYKTIVVKVPKRKPAMYRIGDVLISHPKIIQELMKSMDNLSSSAIRASTSMADFSNVYREK